MFTGCTSLESTPLLPARKLEEYCYYGMFSMCLKINRIEALFEMTDDQLMSRVYTGFWLDCVALEGTFVKSHDATWTLTGPHGVPEGWSVTTE